MSAAPQRPALLRRLRGALALALALAGQAPASAETSGHERTGVERSVPAELSVAQSLEAAPDGDGGFSFDAEAGLELRLGRGFFAGLALPARAVLAEGRAGPLFAAALGDPSLSVGLSFRAGDARLSLEARCSEPLGVAEPYEAAARGLASGSGERGLELAGGAVLFADPLALSLRLAAALASPPSWPPVPRLSGLALSLGATEALNAEFAYSLALAQRLAFRPPGSGSGVAPERALPGYSASLSFAVLRSGPRGQLRVSVAKELSAASAPSVGFSFAYRVPMTGREAGP